jgi:hypothetical protein
VLGRLCARARLEIIGEESDENADGAISSGGDESDEVAWQEKGSFLRKLKAWMGRGLGSKQVWFCCESGVWRASQVCWSSNTRMN